MHHIRIQQVSSLSWCVGVGPGHYANWLTIPEAIEHALRLAAMEAVEEVGIYDRDGKLVSTLNCKPASETGLAPSERAIPHLPDAH